MAADNEWVVADADAGSRLDKFLAADGRLGSRARAASALERRKIFVNGVEASLSDAGRRVGAGDVIRHWIDRPGSAGRPSRRGRVGGGPLDIVFEDDALIVVNKPAGLLSVPLERNAGVPSIFDAVEDYLRSHGRRRPLPVHRIDQDTSGLVVFAKNADAQRALKDQFKRGAPERVYLAVVYGVPQPREGVWRDVLVWDEKALVQKATHPNDPRGVEAISEYRVIEAFSSTSVIEVRLRTGRRNQIRLQARLRGHTLVGEARYTYGPAALRPIPFGRQALHAHRLTLQNVDGRKLDLEAPVPADLRDLLSRLRRAG
jgi:23S rRNA pseudouridine1911/1915/1917 synthase